jgi:hypothetical protein
MASRLAASCSTFSFGEYDCDACIRMTTSFQTLMTSIADAHRRFAEVWETTKAEELRKRGLSPHDSLALPMEDLWQVNHVAYTAAKSEAAERDRLLRELFGLLPDPVTTDTNGIDAIFEFLEVDVLAHRCGYTKAWYYHRLKRVQLTPKQVERLRRHCLDVCSAKGNRPEISKLARLMVRHADAPLITDLSALVKGKSEFARRKARKVLQVILNGRPDLRGRS